MFEIFKREIESKTCFHVGDATAEYKKFMPKNSMGEFIETFIIVELGIGEVKKFAHIVQTFNKYGTKELRYVYVSDKKDKPLNFENNPEPRPELFRIMDEAEISIDELAEDIYSINNKPLPKTIISGIFVHYKLRDTEIPGFMEVEQWTNDRDSMETRFIVSTEKQKGWLASLIDVDLKYFEKYEYITLYN